MLRFAVVHLAFLIPCSALDTLVVFRARSRNTYGFGTEEGFTLPSLSLKSCKDLREHEVEFNAAPGGECFLKLSCDAEHAKAAVSRSILCFGLYEVCGEGRTFSAALKSCSIPPHWIEPFGSWRGEVTRCGQSNSLDQHAFRGKLATFVGKLEAGDSKRCLDSAPQKIVSLLGDDYFYIGRQVAMGPAAGRSGCYSSSQRRPRAGYLGLHALNKRPYTTKTALEPEIAFIMCNIADVGVTDAVLDPCCGSGSVLLAARQLGAECVFGADIDPQQLQQEKVAMNFRALKLRQPDQLVIAAVENLEGLLGDQKFSAIIVDPPYGIKAQAKGSSDADSDSERVIQAILSLAAGRLTSDGRLVMLIPAPGAGTGKEVPGMKALEEMGLVCSAMVKQAFTPTFCRWLARTLPPKSIQPAKIQNLYPC
ncbi:unnamed protein product [Chrysoparadoxa australica]